MELYELYTYYRQCGKICTDTRNIEEGCLFLALKGERFDGNRFAKEALEKGARYAVVDDPSLSPSEGFLFVKNTLKALQGLARHHRQQFSFPVIALTGSNGKTTTKELTGQVLGQKYKAFITPGNLNNHIGVPLTLLSIDPEETQIAVIELGANHLGENELLANICEPDYGLVTNIGKDHLEGFGGWEGCIKANKELYDHLARHNGKAFLHIDDKVLQSIFPGNLSAITYGTKDKCYVKGKLLSADPFVHLEWTTENRREPQQARSHMIGTYNFENLLAAICIGEYFEVPPEKIAKALASYTPDNNRSQVVPLGTNTLILDAYNANPTSMEAALRSFAGMEDKNKYFILGDMLELGEAEEKEHKAILSLLEELGLNRGVLVGKAFSRIGRESSYPVFPTIEAASSYLDKENLQKTTILLKGSRGIELEKAKNFL